MMYLFDKEKKAISVFSKQICVFFYSFKKIRNETKSATHH